MPLPSSTPLAPHFLASELDADNPAATDTIVQHLTGVASWLEAARAVLGVPLRVTDGFRDPAHNAAVGGVADSEHLDGYAADFVPEGLTKLAAYQTLTAAQAAGTLPAFDELVYYTLDDHIHVGVRPTFRGNVEVQMVEGGVKRYVVLTSALAAQLWGSVPAGTPDGHGGACAR